MSPLAILRDSFSNNNFLKAEDVFFSQIICSLLFCYYEFKLLISSSIDREFVGGKDSSRSVLSVDLTEGLAHIDAQ